MSTPESDTLQHSWDRVEQIVRDAVRPPDSRPRCKAPSDQDQLFFELWRIRRFTQRAIAKRYGTTQSAVFRACRRVEKWLGSATNEELGELPAEAKFRAAVRIHERKTLYAERNLLRDYRRSGLPVVSKKTRVRLKPDEAKGELERWVETVEKPQPRNPKFLVHFVKLSREELTLAGRRFPMKMHQDRRFPRELSAERGEARMKSYEQLVEELQILHQEYVERLVNHQKIYGYMDKYALKRDCAPSIPLGGWVKQCDFSARRDQPGAHTFDEAENMITAESVYGPPEQWQPGQPEWFARKRAERAAEGSGGDGASGGEGEGAKGGEGEGERVAGERLSPTLPLSPSPPLAAAVGESRSESSPAFDSPLNREKPRENGAESGPGPARESESNSESKTTRAGGGGDSAGSGDPRRTREGEGARGGEGEEERVTHDHPSPTPPLSHSPPPVQRRPPSHDPLHIPPQPINTPDAPWEPTYAPNFWGIKPPPGYLGVPPDDDELPPDDRRTIRLQ